MTIFCRLGAAVLFLAILSSFLPAQQKEPDSIAQWVEDLGAKRFAVREAAKKKLQEAGEKAETALRKAAKSSDAEVAHSAAKLLEFIDWGMLPGTPKKTLELIGRFKADEENDRREVIGELCNQQPFPIELIKKLLAKEDNLEKSINQYSRLADRMRKPLFELMLNRDDETALKILEVSANGPDCNTVADYAMMLKKMNRLPEAIAKWNDAKNLSEAQKRIRPLILVDLYYLIGDKEKAEKAATLAPTDYANYETAFRFNDWKGLVEHSIHDELQCYNVAIKAQLFRLLGESEKAEQLEKQLIKNAEENGDDDNSTIALMLIGKSKEGLSPLQRSHLKIRLCFEVLGAQMKFKEAFEFLEDADHGAIDERAEILRFAQLRRAKMLAYLGEKDAAVQIFRKFKSDFRNTAEEITGLIKFEVKAGFTDLALESLADCFSSATPEFVKENKLKIYGDSLQHILPQKSNRVMAWMLALQKTNRIPIGIEFLRRAVRIMEGKEPPEKLDEAISLMGAKPAYFFFPQPGSDDVPLGSATAIGDDPCYELIGEALVAAQRWDEAAKFYEQRIEKDPTFRAIYARFLFDRSRFAEAAKQFALLPKDQINALTVILHGISLRNSGQKAEGVKRIELGHWLPLADSDSREELLKGLDEHGLREESDRELQMILEQLGGNEVLRFVALQRRGRAALRTKDFRGGAIDLQKCLLECLRHSVKFDSEPAQYLLLPQLVKAFQALDKLQRGQFEEGLAELKAHDELVPGDITIAIEAYRILKKAKRIEDAEAVRIRCRDVYVKAVKDYPRFAQGWNAQAWLNVNCRMELSEAMKQAQKAVILEPENAGYKDTLAECCFCTGDKAKAIELMKECIKSAPKRAYYQRQLKRFQTQSPETSWPDEDDED